MEANKATYTHSNNLVEPTYSGHTACMDNNADSKGILLASPPVDWCRQPGRPRIAWLSTVQQVLRHEHLMLSGAADLAQNYPLWRMMSMYSATQSQTCMPEMLASSVHF